MTNTHLTGDYQEAKRLSALLHKIYGYADSALYYSRDDVASMRQTLKDIQELVNDELKK